MELNLLIGDGHYELFLIQYSFDNIKWSFANIDYFNQFLSEDHRATFWNYCMSFTSPKEGLQAIFELTQVSCGGKLHSRHVFRLVKVTVDQKTEVILQ